MPMSKIIFAILFVMAWVAFAWWTIRRLWKSPEDPREARKTKEVKIIGVAFSIVIALIVPEEMPMPPFTYWQQAVFFAVYSFPFGLWVGQFSMRMFHAFVDSYYS